MIINFQGEDYNFSADDLTVVQARKIKRELGMTIKQWQEGLGELDPDALVGLYWLMMAQNGKAVDMHKVDFKIAELGEAFDRAAEAQAEASAGADESQGKAPRAQK